MARFLRLVDFDDGGMGPSRYSPDAFVVDDLHEPYLQNLVLLVQEYNKGKKKTYIPRRHPQN